MSKQMEMATLGNGCFWCTESIFQQLKGVISVKSGYSGGPEDDPCYEDVCAGLTGHAEVIQIQFDSSVLTFGELLEVFWKTHDPTTLNRQGNDVGTQYRSAIFYHSAEQKATAQQYLTQLDVSDSWANPIVTEITAYDQFFEAENYHDNYFKENGTQPYCSFVIRPKVEKFREEFKDKLKG